MRSVVGSAVLLRCVSGSVSTQRTWLTPRSECVPEKALESCGSRVCYDVTVALMFAVWTLIAVKSSLLPTVTTTGSVNDPLRPILGF